MYLMQAVVTGAESIHRPAFPLAKAWVMLMNLAPAAVKQQELEFDKVGIKDRYRFMSAVDAINDRFVRESICVGNAGAANTARVWSML